MIADDLCITIFCFLMFRVQKLDFIYEFNTVKILNIGTCMSEQTVKILIRLLLGSSLIRIYTVCHSFCIFWRHYFLVKLNCLILRTTMVAGLGVPIFRVFTVIANCYSCIKECHYSYILTKLILNIAPISMR